MTAPTLNSKIFDGNNDTSGVVFSRPARTWDDFGVEVSPNTPRRARLQSIVGRSVWGATGFTLSGGSPRILGVGVGQDNETPLVVCNEQSPNRIRVFSASPLIQSSSTTYEQIATQVGAPSGVSFSPSSAEVYHGLIVLLLERTVSSNIEGISLVYSTDLGASWSYVPVEGVTPSASIGAGDIPSWPVEVTTGNAGNIWSTNVRGVDSATGDLRKCWFAWTDYIDDEGGSGGIMRATRSTDTGNWSVENAREIYREYDNDNVSLHAHCCSVVGDDAVAIIWGDADTSQRVTLHTLDLNNYATATVTDNLTWHGEKNASGVFSPQPVSPAPAPDGGTFYSNDLQSSAGILKLAEVSSASDDPLWSRVVPSASSAAPLHLRWVNGSGGPVYCAGGGNNQIFHLSKDGVRFCRFSIAGTGVTGRIYSDGSRLYAVGSSDLKVADLPVITSVAPIKCYAGGDNFANQSTWGPISNTGHVIAGVNTRRQVTYASGEYRYTDDSSLLDPQPLGPPPHPTAVIYSINFAGSSSGGGYKVRNPDNGSYSAAYHTGTVAVYPLNADRGCAAELTWYLRGSGINAGDGEAHLIHARDEWRRVSTPNDLVMSGTNVQPVCRFYSRWASNAGNNEILFQVLSFSEGVDPIYTMDGEALSQPHELLSVPTAITGTSWTYRVVLIRPDEMQFNPDVTRPVFTIYADVNNYIEVTYNASTGDWVFDFVNDSTSDGTITVDATRMKVGGLVNIVLTSDGTDTNATVVNSSGIATSNATLDLSLPPSRLHNGNSDQSDISSWNWAAVEFADEYSDATAITSLTEEMTLIPVIASQSDQIDAILSLVTAIEASTGSGPSVETVNEIKEIVKAIKTDTVK